MDKDSPICLVCKEDFSTEAGLHRHVRAHGMRLAEYYQKFFPRYDKYTKTELIHFSNKTQYFSSEFNSRRNLVLWLQSLPKEELLIEGARLLTNRKLAKGLIYAPTQVELRSVTLPGMKWYNDNYEEGYHKLCARLGFSPRFEYYEFRNSPVDLSKDKIIVDTREQIPLRFMRPVDIRCLKFADYKMEDDAKTCNCYIERKSLADFYGTLGGGYERFRAEMTRAKEANAYIVVLVEEVYENIYKFPRRKSLKNKTKVSAEYIMHNVRDLIQEFPNIQFLFVDGRVVAGKVVEKIFSYGCEVPKVDLQYMYDIGKL